MAGGRTVPLELVAKHGAAALYRCGEQRVLLLAGTPNEMGRQHGALLRDEVRLVLQETLAWAEAQGLSRDELTRMHGRLGRHLPARYTEEMTGLAEAAGVPLELVQQVHAMPSRFHCSGAAVARSATVDGKLLHTRSLDYALGIGRTSRLQNHALLIVRQPEDGVPNVVPAWAGFLGAVTGMNGAGITVGEMGSSSKDESFDGLAMIFMVREVLRRATALDAAVDVFRRGPRTCGFNFIVGSGDERRAVAIEVTHSKMFVAGMGDDAEAVPPHVPLVDAVRRTNHFVDRELAATQRDPYDPRQSARASWALYDAITRYLQAHHGRLDEAAMIELLRQYPPGHACLHQAVMAGSDRRIWVSHAADDRVLPLPGAQNRDFYGYDLRQLLQRREPMTAIVQPAIDAPAAAASPASGGAEEPRAAVRGAGGATANGGRAGDTGVVTTGVTSAATAGQSNEESAVTAPAPEETRVAALPSGDVELRARTVQRRRDAVVRQWRSEGSELPLLETHAPLDGGRVGIVLFGTGGDTLTVERALAQALVHRGAAVVIVPIRGSRPTEDPLRAAVAWPAARVVLPKSVAPTRVAFLGLGLGAFPALQAAADDASAPPLVLALTAAGLADLWREDDGSPRREVVRWLGGEPAALAEFLRAVAAMQPQARDGAGVPALPALRQRRSLFLGLHGESRLPLEAQQRLAEALPAGETEWYENGLRTLPLQLDAIATRIVQFVER